MKRGKRLLLLLSALAVIVAVYFAVSHFAPGNKSKAEDNASLTVASISKDSVAGLSWTYGAKTLSLKNTNAKWSYTGDSAFPLDQIKVLSMLGAVSNLKATRTIQNVSDLSEYGLSKPACVITVISSDGKETKFSIGDLNDVSKEYYLKLDGKSNVYTVDDSLIKAFPQNIYDMIKMEVIPYISNIKTMQVEKSLSPLNLIYMDKGGEYSYTDSYHWYYQNGSTLSPLSEKKMSELSSTVTGLSWKGCVSYKATDADLALYGLKNSQAKVMINYTEKQQANTGKTDKDGNPVVEEKDIGHTFGLLIGNPVGDYYYAKLAGSDMVYEIDASAANAILSANYTALLPDDVCLMDWNTVDSLEVTADGKKAEISFLRKGDGKSGNKTTSYKVNGADADSKAVEAFLKSITDLEKVDETNDKSGAKTPEVSVTFHRNTEYFKTMTLTLSPLGDYYLVTFNGESRLLTGKDGVSSLKDALSAILKK
ncbi:MAG: DUF4340 domain-containing protein [Bacillota bacterium]|nr:DUF4340 domain-containing protein [Bacillota bacterium]